jgi:membrane associated rhomboid family serine protease
VIYDREKQVELDHCQRCKGIFLEPGEATKALTKNCEPSVWLAHKSTMHLGKSKLICPVDGEKMDAYIAASEHKAIEIDYCHSCKGLWLDASEGKKLPKITRENQLNDEEQAKHEEPGILSYLFQLLTRFPVEGYNPVRSYTYALYTIIATIVVCFIVQIAYFSNHGLQEIDLYRAVGIIPKQVLAGEQIWTMFSHIFFHAGIMHLLGNLYFLYVFGDNIEDTMGSTKFLLIFFASAFLGAALHLALYPNSNIPMIGASGAISGILGAYLLLFPRVDVYVMIFVIRVKLNISFYLGFWIIYQVAMYFISHPTGGGVAWLAHIGGFVCGLLLAGLMRNLSPVIQLRIADNR